MHIKAFLNFCFSFYLTFCFDKGKKYRCGFDSINFIPITINNTLPTNNKHLNSYKVTYTYFKSFNIYLDLLQFDEEIIKYNLESKKTLFTNALNKAVNTLTKLLRVKEQKYDLITTDEQIISLGIYKWNKDKIGNKVNINKKGLKSFGIDLYIFVKFGNNTEMGEEVLASAFVGMIDPFGQPIVGVINLNKDVDYSKEKSPEFLKSIILHEMTHVLGFNIAYFVGIYEKYFYTKNESGIYRGYLKSPELLRRAKKYYNCNSIEGIPLEEIGGDGTFVLIGKKEYY